MQDALVTLGRHSLSRLLLKKIGIPSPQALLRADSPWSSSILAGKKILIKQGGLYAERLIQTIQQQQGKVEYREIAEVSSLSTLAGAAHETVGSSLAIYQGSVLDTTLFRDLADLRQLYDFFKVNLPKCGTHHRLVFLLADPGAIENPIQNAVIAAIEGFMRSLAKETGSRGMNVNGIRVKAGTAVFERLEPIVTFFLSNYAAFITGQIIDCSAFGGKSQIPSMAGSLAGKRALVTGAAQGIGNAICRRLAEEGAHVICLDRPESRAELRDLVATIEGEALEVDLMQAAAVQNILSHLQKNSQGIDILVHNAGITRDRRLQSMTERQWDDVLQTNLNIIVQLTQACLHHNLIHTGGRIICLSSISGLAGNHGQTNYSAAKAGLVGYVKALAQPLAGLGITANAVAPGLIETSMTAGLPFVLKQVARRFSSLSQGGTPDDVAELICFLASPCSQGINGSTLRICGGSFFGA